MPQSSPVAAFGSLLDALRGVRWPVRRAVSAALPGSHLSRLRGAAPELSEYRPYRQGDDPRRLDWRLLARSDRAFIRLADERAVLATVLLVDASASMAWPEPARDKWRRATELAVGLAAVAHASADPVGLVVPTAGGVVRLPARTRSGTVSEMAQALAPVRPAGTAALAPALQAVTAGRVAIISDFLGDAESLLRTAGVRLAAGGDVHAVHVVAREELEPAGGSVLATDPEAPALARPLTSASRDGYLAAFADWRRELADAWRASGASYTMVVTDEPAAAAVRRIVAPGPVGAPADRPSEAPR
ncbi:MAG: DUF58 domain-containing protein [Gemmatimonadaceae bacterium]